VPAASTPAVSKQHSGEIFSHHHLSGFHHPRFA